MAFKKALKNSKCFTCDLDAIMKAAEEDVRRRTEVESRDWQAEEYLMREKSDFE